MYVTFNIMLKMTWVIKHLKFLWNDPAVSCNDVFERQIKVIVSFVYTVASVRHFVVLLFDMNTWCCSVIINNTGTLVIGLCPFNAKCIFNLLLDKRPLYNTL